MFFVDGGAWWGLLGKWNGVLNWKWGMLGGEGRCSGGRWLFFTASGQGMPGIWIGTGSFSMQGGVCSLIFGGDLNRLK